MPSQDELHEALKEAIELGTTNTLAKDDGRLLDLLQDLSDALQAIGRSVAYVEQVALEAGVIEEGDDE